MHQLSSSHNYITDQMKKSLAILDTNSKIELPKVTFQQSLNRQHRFQIRWFRKSARKSEFPNKKEIKLQSPLFVCQTNKSIYICTPFDFGHIVSAHIYQKTSSSEDQAQFCQNNITKQIQFGPIEMPAGFEQKLLCENLPDIQIVLNKNVPISASIQISPSFLIKTSPNDVFSIKISTQGSDFTIKYPKNILQKGEQVLFQVYQNEQNTLGIYVFYQYKEFMQFLKKMKVCWHYGKYLKVYCSTKEDRDLLIYHIMSWYDPEIANIFEKKGPILLEKIQEKAESLPETPSTNMLKISKDLKDNNENQVLINTFGKGYYVQPEQNDDESCDSMSINDSPYFKHYRSQGEFDKLSHKFSNFKQQQFEMHQKKYQKNINDKQTDQKRILHSQEPYKCTPGLDPQLDDAFEDIFPGEDPDDQYYFSPSLHMVEDIYNILYSPYSKNKPRRESFSSQNEVLFNEGLPQHQQLNKNNSKKEFTSQNDRPPQNDSHKFRQTMKENPHQYFLDITENQQSKLNLHTMNIVPEETSGKTSNNDSGLDQFYSENMIPDAHPRLQAQNSNPQSEQGNANQGNQNKRLTKIQVHQFIKRESFFRQKIEYLTKINQHLMRQNIHLKSIIKFERETKQKADIARMHEIKQMALNMIKRLERVEKQEYNGEDRKIINGQEMKEIFQGKNGSQSHRNSNSFLLHPSQNLQFPKNNLLKTKKNNQFKHSSSVEQSLKLEKKPIHHHLNNISPHASNHTKARLSTEPRFSAEHPVNNTNLSQPQKQNTRYQLGKSLESQKTYSHDKKPIFGNNKSGTQMNNSRFHNSKRQNNRYHHQRSDLLMSPSSHNSQKRRESSLKRFLQMVSRNKHLKDKAKEESPPKKFEQIPHFLKKKGNELSGHNTHGIVSHFNSQITEPRIEAKNKPIKVFPQGNSKFGVKQQPLMYRSNPTIPCPPPRGNHTFMNSLTSQLINKGNMIFNYYPQNHQKH